MVEGFAPWLAQRSWAEAVRFCKMVALLVPVVALLVDLPLLHGSVVREHEARAAIVVWHAVTFGLCIGVVAADRWWRQRLPLERATHAVAALVLVQSAWLGMLGWPTLRDYSMYALGSVFVATVLGTASRAHQPLYVLGAVAVGIAMVWKLPGRALDDLLNALVAPLCVAVVSLQLDRYSRERNLALFTEMSHAQRERERADRVLYNVLPASVAEELKRADRVNAVKFERIGVLFADIEGFTRFSHALEPESLVRVLNEIFCGFDALVDRHGLEKIKTIGDAYMAISQKQTADLARLALDMLAALDAYNARHGTRLRLRIGMHVGPAVAGVIGVKRFLYDVWGDTVNVASRMEASGEAGRIHATEAVREELGERFGFEPREPMPIKGMGVMRTYFLGRPA
jgi:adenylate cyclase